jgi:hypothetical protein
MVKIADVTARASLAPGSQRPLPRHAILAGSA